MTPRTPWIALATAVSAAAYFVGFRLHEKGPDMPAWDTYSHFYPNMLHALDALWDGGRGLLWNPLQNCGQPFFASIEAGLLYPANVFFLFLDPDRALRAVLFFDLAVGGLSTYFLCTALGLGPAAAVGGALAFELGNATAFNTMWAPQAAGSYAWFPAAMLCCERLLREPRVRGGAALGTVLALALLAGFPQTVLFAYQLIALRVMWEVATRGVRRPAAVVLVTIFGLALPVLLAAVQLLPALEVARESVRGERLSLVETSVLGRLAWEDFQKGAVFRSALHNPLLLVPVVLASTALLTPGRRRTALFYAGAGVLYFALALGTNTSLFELYTRLPWGGLFREPVRFMWVVGFCLAVLTAFGLDALVSGARRTHTVAWVAACLPVLAVAGFRRLAPDGLSMLEWVLAGAVVVSWLLAALWPAQAPRIALLALAAVVVNLVGVPGFTYMRLLPNGQPLFAHATLFGELRARLTPHDRIYIAPRYPHFDLMPKSASIFGLPSIQDYGSQTSDRYARLYLRLRLPRRLRTRFDTDFSFFGDHLYANTSRPLLDLVGTRYLVVAAGADAVIASMKPALTLVHDGEVHAYENSRALPRAFWVPRVAVATGPDGMLGALASAVHDPRQVALVEAPAPSGFAGGAGDGRAGNVEFLTNEPEHLVLRVDAPQRGFLFLSDQYFPGWRATVGGAPATIVRANYAFRLVEVPRGRSLVEFRYAPASVRLGFVISGATLVGVAMLLWRTGPRQTRLKPRRSLEFS
jgi:hypothetical protein